MILLYYPFMNDIIEFQTSRLKLRQWREDDLPVFSRLNADPLVMKFYPNVLTTEESNTMANKIAELIAINGWGFWAVELIHQKSFIGFVGLNQPVYELPVSPCVEIGWRLASDYWGRGYATEAAEACLDLAFDQLGLNQVFSFASVGNLKSRAVMQRLNMLDTKSNFDHPMIPAKHSLREHVLYMINKRSWYEHKNIS